MTRYQLHPTAAWRKVGGAVFVVTDDRALHKLANDTAAHLFSALQAGATTSDELIAALVATFDVDPEQAAVDVQSFLQTLLERRVLTTAA